MEFGRVAMKWRKGELDEDEERDFMEFVRWIGAGPKSRFALVVYALIFLIVCVNYRLKRTFSR
jgi:hypothetical protein